MTRPTAKQKKLRLLDRLILRTLEHRVVDGLWLGAPDKPTLDLIEAGLSLIRLHDPLRYRQVGRDLKRVLVMLIGSGNFAEYQYVFDACVFGEKGFADLGLTASQIASTIVHEATHARLQNIGVVYSESNRLRHESICVRRQIAFLRRVPGAEKELASAVDTLERLPKLNEDGMWKDASFAERRAAAEQAMMEYYKVPEWAEHTLRGVQWFYYRYQGVSYWLRTRLGTNRSAR
jgi:hypothetical protein